MISCFRYNNFASAETKPFKNEVVEPSVSLLAGPAFIQCRHFDKYTHAHLVSVRAETHSHNSFISMRTKTITLHEARKNETQMI